MIEWLAASILFTPNGVPLEGSDAWANPYVEPVKGERVALRPGELKTAVTGLNAEVTLVPWMPKVAKVIATVSLRNPGTTWLRWVRIDVEAADQAHIARTLSTSFLVSTVQPGETVTRTNDRLWVHVGPNGFGQVRYKTTATVAGGYRLQVKP